ncbi:MAG: DNA primase [Acidobacteriota bacterium]
MPLFTQQFIDDLRLQANIVRVVEEYVPLKRAGVKYKGLCPFHSEKTPSFTVDADKGFFYCFGCQAGGDVFKFLELHEKVGFQDAVRLLAQKFGVTIPANDDATPEEARRDAALREQLLKVHEVAAAFFRDQLAGPAGARARRQLAARDVSVETIAALGLGVALGAPAALKTRLLEQGFTIGVLLQSGLVQQRDSGDVVDRFRNRLMVPICRDTGSVIAFGGRAMDDEQVPKYLNSPETPIYSKGRTLYGLNLSKTSLRQFGYAVLVEGYFDFAQVFQTQAAPVVASCGTALTQHQAQLLRRFTTRVVLSYDPDAAGQGAAARSCELLVAEGFDVNVAVLDKGEDPDTYIRRHGPDGYREKLRHSRPYLEYLLEQAAAGVDFSQDDSRRQFLGKMLTVASRIPDPAGRDQFGDRIAHKARITEEVVRSEIRKAAVSRRPALTERELPSFGHWKHAEKGLIWALIHNPDAALDAMEELDAEDFELLAGRDVFEMARSLQNQAERYSPSAFLQRLSTVNAQLVTSIAASPTPPAPAADCARAIKRLRCERDRAAIQREIDRLQELGADQYGHEIDVLWQRKIDLLHRIEDLT